MWRVFIDFSTLLNILYLAFMKQMNEKNELARFTNHFAFNAQIGFTDARQLLLFLALVSQTNPHDKDEPMTGILSINDIQLLIRKERTKSKGVYKETQEFIDKMMENNFVKFVPTDIDDPLVRKHLKNYGVVFDRLRVIKGGEGTFYQYRFHEDMRIHIKELKRDFVSLNLPKGMKSGHAIRFLLLAKAHHDNLRLHKKVTCLKISLIDLKRILGIEKKYSMFADFRKWVLEPIVSEVNKSSLLYIKKYKFIRTSRKVTHIEFYLEDGEIQKRQVKKRASEQLEGQTEMDFTQKTIPSPSSNPRNFVPDEIDIAKLTRSQLLAYNYLVDRKCIEGIVYRQIVQKVPSSEYLGWEDVFVQKAWKRFEKGTKYTQEGQKAGAFVKWWMKGEFKDRLFSEIMEEVIKEKKSRPSQEQTNREAAKTMTASEYETWRKKEKATPTRKEPVTRKKGMHNLGDLISKSVKHISPPLPFDGEKWKKENPKDFRTLQNRVIEEYRENYKEAFDLVQMADMIEEKTLYYAKLKEKELND